VQNYLAFFLPTSIVGIVGFFKLYYQTEKWGEKKGGGEKEAKKMPEW
jgi:hypothetical protein